MILLQMRLIASFADKANYFEIVFGNFKKVSFAAIGDRPFVDEIDSQSTLLILRHLYFALIKAVFLPVLALVSLKWHERVLVEVV